MEAELVKREGISFTSIPAAGLHGVGLGALPRNSSRLARGFAASRRILLAFRPDILLFTGGYLAAPMALANRLARTDARVLLFVPDIQPGMALKFLAGFADRLAVSAADSQQYFKRTVVVTGYPLRASLTGWSKSKGRAAFNLRDDLPVLLVAGGSLGARSINDALTSHLADLLELTQIVHVTGRAQWDAVQRKTTTLTATQVARYRPFPYLDDEMGAALASADLVVARAGASTLGEFPAFGLPAIVVPYPHAWRYQRVNADFLARRNAALILADDALDRELPSLVGDLLRNPARLATMRESMQALSRPQAAEEIAEQILALGGGRS
jgi:UDP-N-acetylglucosamine--N-acetylmuramyl-(pentapeptide) pyrophosphoryl-undecaprenol N-acetylglucosamine transferase